MVEKVLQNFKMFELKRDLEFVFDEVPHVSGSYKVRLTDDCIANRYVEFIPKAEYVISVKKKGWKEEALKFFRVHENLYLVLYFPKDTKAVMRDIDYPHILIERKEETNRWIPIGWLYYYYRVYNGLCLVSKASAEGIIELVVKCDDWAVEI